MPAAGERAGSPRARSSWRGSRRRAPARRRRRRRARSRPERARPPCDRPPRAGSPGRRPRAAPRRARRPRAHPRRRRAPRAPGSRLRAPIDGGLASTPSARSTTVSLPAPSRATTRSTCAPSPAIETESRRGDRSAVEQHLRERGAACITGRERQSAHRRSRPPLRAGRPRAAARRRLHSERLPMRRDAGAREQAHGEAHLAGTGDERRRDRGLADSGNSCLPGRRGEGAGTGGCGRRPAAEEPADDAAAPAASVSAGHARCAPSRPAIAERWGKASAAPQARRVPVQSRARRAVQWPPPSHSSTSTS